MAYIKNAERVMFTVMALGVLFTLMLFFHCEQPPRYPHDVISEEERELMLEHRGWDMV